MNILIVGAGETGRHLAEQLSGHHHNICVIDSSENLTEELQERLDTHIICGNGSSVTTLAEANVGECDLCLALTSDDETNLVAASLAKALGAKKTIARVHGRVQRDEWLFDYKAHFGLDYIFSTERLAAVELAKFVRNPDRVMVEEIARGRIELQQTRITPDSKAAGTSLIELKLPARVRVAAIERAGTLIIPTGQDRLELGDMITLFGQPQSLDQVLPLFDPETRHVEEVNVVIFGGGEYGLALAQMLEGRKYRVRIIEPNAKICQRLASSLQRTVVINADATSLQHLKEEQIGSADFFIAVSNDDEDNVMTCLQARSLGTKYTLALIHKADYADVISRNGEQLGIRGAVSPRVATGRDLMRFVTADRFHVLLKLKGGADIFECPVPRLSPITGRKVCEITWPPGCGLVALLHENDAIVPIGEDVINAGDTIYALVAESARKQFLKLIAD